MGCTIDSKNPTSPRISAITVNRSTNSQDFGPAYVFFGPISATNGQAAIINAKNSPISSYAIAMCAAAISVCFKHAQSIIFYSSCGPTSTSYEFKSTSYTNSLITSSAASVFKNYGPLPPQQVGPFTHPLTSRHFAPPSQSASYAQTLTNKTTW